MKVKGIETDEWGRGGCAARAGDNEKVNVDGVNQSKESHRYLTTTQTLRDTYANTIK